MKKIFLSFFILTISLQYACEKPIDKVDPIEIKTIVINEADKDFGYYLSVPPMEKIKAVLVLLPGFGQKAEDIFLDTKLHEHAFSNNMLTIGFSGRTRMTADSLIREKLNAVLSHVLKQHDVDVNNFFFGGFSAGGVIALRYVELCKEFPKEFPVNPKAVFMADSPIDLFFSEKMMDENLINNYSEVSVNEAKWVAKFYQEYYHATPKENPTLFKELSPFSINKAFGNNDIFLKDVAVRAYHDVDIAWRLINRNQTAKFDNFVATSELINRLILSGNKKAEFIQTFKTGYRRNGKRHPHSWSIIDPQECIEWIKKMIQ